LKASLVDWVLKQGRYILEHSIEDFKKRSMNVNFKTSGIPLKDQIYEL
jgi:hypothetical protein